MSARLPPEVPPIRDVPAVADRGNRGAARARDRPAEVAEITRVAAIRSARPAAHRVDVPPPPATMFVWAHSHDEKKRRICGAPCARRTSPSARSGRFDGEGYVIRAVENEQRTPRPSAVAKVRRRRGLRHSAWHRVATRKAPSADGCVRYRPALRVDPASAASCTAGRTQDGPVGAEDVDQFPLERRERARRVERHGRGHRTDRRSTATQSSDSHIARGDRPRSVTPCARRSPSSMSASGATGRREHLADRCRLSASPKTTSHSRR
jgi:hypothetical protein